MSPVDTAWLSWGNKNRTKRGRWRGRKWVWRLSKTEGCRDRGKKAVSFACHIWFASAADRKTDGLFGEKVCEGDGSGKASVNTCSAHRKKTYMCAEALDVLMHCVYVRWTAWRFRSNLMMERAGLDPYAFPHQSQPHFFCQPQSLALASDPTPSCTTRRANRSKLALHIQRSRTTFPCETAVWDLLHPQLDMAE